MSDHVHWDAAPELHQPQGAPRAAAERLAATARAHLLKPIPLLETLSHAEWFFANGANAKLRADPAAARPFMMDPTKPELYARLLPIVDELIEVFEPRWLHIGHDEVRNVHPFPATPEQREIGYGRLFTGSVARLHEHLAARGVATMLWDDELVAPEVRAVWSELPDDLTVVSWRYLPAGAYPRLELVAGAGFRTLSASWFEPDNVSSMAPTVARLGDAGAGGARLVPLGLAGGPAGRTAQRGAGRPRAAGRPAPGSRPVRSASTTGMPCRAWRSATVVSAACATGWARPRRCAAPTRGRATCPSGSSPSPSAAPPAPSPSCTPPVGTRPRARRSAATRSCTPTASVASFRSSTAATSPPGPRPRSRPSTSTNPGRASPPNGLEIAAYQIRWRNPRPEVTIDRIEVVAGDGIAAPIVFGVTLLD